MYAGDIIVENVDVGVDIVAVFDVVVDDVYVDVVIDVVFVDDDVVVDDFNFVVAECSLKLMGRCSLLLFTSGGYPRNEPVCRRAVRTSLVLP